AQEAAGLPGVRQAVYAAIPARRHHGVGGGGVRRVLRVRAAPGTSPSPGIAIPGLGPDRRSLVAMTPVRFAPGELRDKILRKCRESMTTKEQFFTEQADRIAECCTSLAKAFDQGARLFVMGNGGSSCDAAHVAVEFMHPIIEKRPPLPAVALTTDTAILTAVGNDQDFSVAFLEQLRMLGRPGDIALGISTSGKSANVN